MTAAGQGPLLQATGLLGGYGGMDILQGVDLAVDAGEVVVVVGPNGAGKSTAMKAADRPDPAEGRQGRL